MSTISSDSIGELQALTYQVLSSHSIGSWDDIRNQLQSKQTNDELKFRDNIEKGYGIASPLHKLRLYDESNKEEDVAAILMVYEGRFRTAEQRVESFVDYQRGKIERALVALAEQTGSYQNGATPDAAEISLACLLDYLDLWALVEWREFAPSLEAWITDFAAHAAGYQATLAPDMPPAPWRNAR